MYRILAFVLLSVATIEGCRPPPCHWSDPTEIENYFNGMVTELVAADTKAQQFCQDHGSYLMIQRHDPFEYKLVLEVPGFQAHNFDVRIRNRVLSVSAVNSYDCESSFFDLRILPEYLETQGAMWKYIGSKLVVSFPYKFETMGGSSRPCYNRTLFISNVRQDNRPDTEDPGSAGPGDSKVNLAPPTSHQ